MGGNLKLILGLIWTLILHYQISVGFGIDDQKKGGKKTTPKQALLGYVKVCLILLDSYMYSTCSHSSV